MLLRMLLPLILLLFYGCDVTIGFMPLAASSSRACRSNVMMMRDASMIVDFEKGDIVKVKADIVLDGINWGGECRTT